MKYWINLYKNHEEKNFINQENGIYRKDTKFIVISKIKKGKSIRRVSVDLGLIEPGILSDWLSKYDVEDLL